MLATLAVAAMLLVPQDPAPARDTTPARKRRPAVGDTLRPRDFEQFVARDTTRARRKGNEIRRIEVTDALRQSAFADAGARELLEKARAARLRNDASIKSYEALLATTGATQPPLMQICVAGREFCRRAEGAWRQWPRRGPHDEVIGFLASILPTIPSLAASRGSPSMGRYVSDG